jgi:hypothetical protein
LLNRNDIIFIRGVAAGGTFTAGARQQPTLVTNEQVYVFIVKGVSKIFASSGRDSPCQTLPQLIPSTSRHNAAESISAEHENAEDTRIPSIGVRRAGLRLALREPQQAVPSNLDIFRMSLSNSIHTLMIEMEQRFCGFTWLRKRAPKL